MTVWPMRTDLFDFELPAERIALRPASPRDSARMLVVQPGARLARPQVSDLPQWLEPGDQLVVNDTKVISAQLKGRRIGRETEPKIEATLIKRLDGSRWQALVKPAKKLSRGRRGSLRQRGQGVPARPSRRRGRGTRATTARSRCRFRFTGRHSIRPSPISAARRCRPISPPSARRTSATPPTTRPCSRPTKARSRRRPPGCISRRRWRRRCASAASASSSDHAACRGRDVPAGQGGRHRGAQDAFRVGRISRRDRGGAECGARKGRPHRRRRHHLAAAIGKRRR